MSTSRRFLICRPRLAVHLVVGCGLALATLSGTLHAQQAGEEPLTAITPEEPPVIVDSAAVKAIRATNPTTPAQLMRAIDQLIQLDRFDLALTYLEQLNGLGLDADGLSQLHEQFGTSAMLKLLHPELQPLGREFALSALAAAKAVSQDPQRIAENISRLGASQREQQLRAAMQLLRSGQFAVPQLVEAIAANGNAQTTKNARAVLARFEREAVAPLVAYLSSGDASLRSAAIDSLGRIGDRQALPYLMQPYLNELDSEVQQTASVALQRMIGSQPSRGEALELLEQTAARTYDGLIPQKGDADGFVSVWTWDESKQSAIPFQLFAEDAAALAASRLYRDLASLDPSNEEYRVRSLLGRLDLEQAIALDRPLREGAGTVFQEGKSAGPIVMQRVLRESLKDRHWIAAIGAANILGAMNDPTILRAPAGEVAPIVLALTDPNRRIRFAAAQAIMQLKPQQSFPGASRLPEALGYFSGSTGDRGILIAHPSSQEGQNLAGLAKAAGFYGVVTTNADEIARSAIESPDLELIMISDAIRGRRLWSLIQELRADPMSADIPIVLLGSGSDAMPALEQIADAHQGVLAFRQPVESTIFGHIVNSGLDSIGREAVDRNRRLDQAALALKWLGDLAEQDPNQYSTLLRQQDQILNALYTPELAELARRVAAKLPTSSSQLALADAAGLTALPMAEREALAQAFDESIRNHGVLLTQAEIQRQYDRYNESRDLDQATQNLLGSLLDTIEAPSSPNQQQ